MEESRGLPGSIIPRDQLPAVLARIAQARWRHHSTGSLLAMAAHLNSTRPGADLAESSATERPGAGSAGGFLPQGGHGQGVRDHPSPPRRGSPARPRPMSSVRALNAATAESARFDAEQLLFSAEVRLLCLPRLAALLARDKARGIAAVLAVRKRRRERLAQTTAKDEEDEDAALFGGH